MRVPDSARSFVALSAAAAAAAAALWHVPGELREAWGEVRNASAQPELERRLLPARAVGLDETAIFLRAAAEIPPGAIYYVDVGDAAPVSDSALDWVRPFATYWLLPRRRTDELGEAEWILSYGGDLQALGLAYERVLAVGRGLALAEVRR
jgi:hypothetical protein